MATHYRSEPIPYEIEPSQTDFYRFEIVEDDGRFVIEQVDLEDDGFGGLREWNFTPCRIFDDFDAALDRLIEMIEEIERNRFGPDEHFVAF